MITLSQSQYDSLLADVAEMQRYKVANEYRSQQVSRVRTVLDKWKTDQHPYMVEEVKNLIADIESALKS